MKRQQGMKLLLDIALGKSVYTICFLAVTVCSVVLALKLENEIATTVALILVGIFGVFIIVTAVVTTNEAIESLRWPKVNATLGICKVSGGIGIHDLYYPSVNYSFEIDGQVFHGNTYILGDQTYSRSTVEDMIAEILSNKDSFMVSYNPSDPSMNVVKPGINSVHYVRALTGIAIVGMVVFELAGWTHFS
jgi:hypothetical protein